LPLKTILALSSFVVATLLGSGLPAEELSVYFKTTPRAELLRPFVDATDLSLLVTGAGGRPVKQGAVAIRLDAPRPGRVFSTDFPVVEGTVLSEMRLPLRQGRANWRQLLPIRGEYRLVVDVVAGDSDSSRASQVFTFKVRENRSKWFALAAFSAGLFILGLVAGRIFTGTRKAAAILGVALSAGLAATSTAQENQPEGVPRLRVETASVGRPAFISWKFDTDAGGAKAGATLTLTITHLEKQKVVFGVDKIPVDAQWSMKFHFPDAGEYRITAVANVPGRAPARSEHGMTVTGVEPPAATMVPVLVYFIGLIATGLGLGRWSKRRVPAR
jgi:hypothetical protein